MYSLSRTLTVRFSLTMFAALVLIALWAYMGTQRILYDQLDRSVWAAYEIELASLEAGRRVPQHVDATDATNFASTVNRFVALRDARAAIVEVNTPWAATLPFDSASFARARDGQASWVTQHWTRGSVRSVFAPVRDSSAGGVVLQVAASLSPMTQTSRTVLLLMAGTVILGTVATMFGAGWLARVSVEPVDAIATQAMAIRPAETGRRITVHADISEYRGLVNVLNHMLERLDRGLESERRIIADVGHDLKTPITAMLGEIEVALRGTRSAEEYRAVLSSVLEEVEQLAATSDALLMLARLEAGELEPHREPTALEPLVADVVHRVRRQSRAEEYSVQLAGSGAEARVDPKMVGVVVEQLLDNAIKHTGTGTNITVDIGADDHTARISVEDDGPGLPADALPHIFERFYRADAARTRGGAGLGLTISKAIADAHGGSIAATQAATGGLRVTLSLPI